MKDPDVASSNFSARLQLQPRTFFLLSHSLSPKGRLNYPFMDSGHHSRNARRFDIDLSSILL